ncbi:hypothetical protein J6W34_05195 [bacterium]|nr:hypothetical protein [bacterium]
MVNSPKSEVIEGGGKLARALNDKGVEVTFGKRSEGNDDLSTVIDMAANQINSSSNVDIVTEWEETLSDEKVPSEKLVKNSLDDKISKLQTNGLIKNDGTINISLNKLSTIIDELKSLGLDLFNYNDTYDLLVYLFYDKLQYNTYDEKVSYTKNGSTYYELATIHDIPDVSTKADKSGGASQITDPNAHSNLGTNANATQSSINSAIDSMIGSNVSVGTFTDLQELIDGADSGDIIVLDKNYKYNSTTDGSLSDGVVIDKIITLIGNGHIIDANNYRKAFSINDSHYGLGLIDLIIQNGSNFGESGGAIYNEGTLIIRDCDFRNNIADSAGAIYTASGSILNISNSSFMYNTANGEHTGGGAIKSYGDLTITNSVFTQNEAYECGAIDSRSTFSLKDSTVKSNDAINYANIYCSTATTVYNCDIDNISTTCYNVTNKPYLTDHQNIKTINNESIIGTGNINLNNAGTFSDLADLMETNHLNPITLTKDYINSDDYDVDGILIERSTDMIIDGGGHIIDANYASKIFRFIPSNIHIDINIVFKNIIFRQASSDSEMGGNYYGTGGAFYSERATLTFDNCVFVNNKADDGGVIHLENNTNLNIFNCYFYQCESYNNGSVIHQNNYSTNVININNSVFIENFASGEGTICLNNTNVKIKDCIFKDNVADTYGDIYNNTNFNLNVYNCDINDVSISCRNVTNITTESLNNSKQPLLESGTNIKTINNESLLGSGNISVGGGSSVDIVTSWESTLSDTKVPSEKLTKNSLDDKISKSNTAGLVKNDGTIDTTTKLTASDIVDNLTTSDATKVLSAKQGKALNDLIGSAITYIVGSGS